MMNDATGTALTAVIRGDIRVRMSLYPAESAASTVPMISASINPPPILRNEFSTVRRKSACGISSKSLFTAATGVTSIMLLLSAIAPACHKASQNNMLSIF